MLAPFIRGAPVEAEPMELRLPERAAVVAEAQERIYAATQKQARYLLGTVQPWKADPALRLLTDSRSGEHWIRPNAGAIEGFAFLYRFGPYDESIVGCPRAELLASTIVPMMRYLVATHVTGPQTTGDGKKWGDAWQSAHWAQMLGRGAWFAWGGLPGDLRAGIRRVVAHEAERIARTDPPHQLRADTKAEENAWNSQILSVALLLLPGDARCPAWARAHQRWVMSSFLRPADATNDAVVDGRPVREQFSGANIFDDFTLENHRFVHPDYMTTFSLSLGCAPDFVLTGRRPPEALWHNVAPIYENLKWMQLPDGGFVYPNGQDWELFRNPSWLGKHVLMAVFGRDPDAWAAMLGSLATLEKMQARSPSGAIFHPGEYFFASTQHDMIRALANAWLSLQLAQEIPDHAQRRLGVRRWDSARIVLRRTPDAIHTVSWGAKIMAQCVPHRLDRLVSPHDRNGVGTIQLAGEKKPLPLKLQQADISQGTDWFEARLTVDHGDAVRAELVFRSDPRGHFTLRERLVAIRDVTTAEIATGLIGILNNPNWVYEKGRRRVEADGERVDVESGYAREWHFSSARRITMDGVLLIEAGQPLRAAYLAAEKAERGRVTDRLVLNYIAGKRAWTAGEVISEFGAEVRSARPAAD